MTHYSEEFRASIAARLLPPNNARVADIVKETSHERAIGDFLRQLLALGDRAGKSSDFKAVLPQGVGRKERRTGRIYLGEDVDHENQRLNRAHTQE